MRQVLISVLAGTGVALLAFAAISCVVPKASCSWALSGAAGLLLALHIHRMGLPISERGKVHMLFPVCLLSTGCALGISLQTTWRAVCGEPHSVPWPMVAGITLGALLSTRIHRASLAKLQSDEQAKTASAKGGDNR